MFKIKFEKQIIDLHCFQKVANLSCLFHKNWPEQDFRETSHKTEELRL